MGNKLRQDSDQLGYFGTDIQEDIFTFVLCITNSASSQQLFVEKE